MIDVEIDSPVVEDSVAIEVAQPNEEDNKFDSTQASIEESKEVPAKTGKLTLTIESAKIQNIGKNTSVSA